MNVSPWCRWLRWCLAGWLVAVTVGARAAAPGNLPDHLSFIAIDAVGLWRLHRISGGIPVPVTTQLEPRHACVAAAAPVAVYAAADESIRLIDLATGRETALARSDSRRAYTQPCLSHDGKERYAVEMRDGKSIETDIVRLLDAPAPDVAPRLIRQAGAQLEPFLHARRWLVYASVSCSEGCERPIIEIWVRDLLAGTARQLTLFNAVSLGPVTDGQRVVFSSNVDGFYALWQVPVAGGTPTRLTSGPHNDHQPALCGGALFFVRSTPAGNALMRLGDDGVTERVALPGLQQLRSLRCAS